MKIVTVHDIIVKYLIDNGYDGLYNNDCACEIDNLYPCGALSDECCFGVKVPCDCGDHGFHIVSRQEEKA